MLALWAAAWAGDPANDWKALYEARFVQIADGTPDNAVKLYQATLLELDPAEPLFSSTAYWLGHAQLALGLLPEAQATLAGAAADPAAGAEGGALYRADVETRDAARALLEEAALRAVELQGVPARWDFEGGSFPAVRGWATADSGDLVIVGAPGERVLSWSTQQTPGLQDRLTLRFAEGASPRTLSFRARVEEGEIAVRVVAVDEWGDRWVSPLYAAGEQSWTDVQVSVPDLAPPAQPAGPVALGRVVDLCIELVPIGLEVRGRATLLLDDVLAG